MDSFRLKSFCFRERKQQMRIRMKKWLGAYAFLIFCIQKLTGSKIEQANTLAQCNLTTQHLKKLEEILGQNDYIIQKGFFTPFQSPIPHNSVYGDFFWQVNSFALGACIPNASPTVSVLFDASDDSQTQCTDEAFSNSFQLGADEQILVVGCTPPATPYFGFQHYLRYHRDTFFGWRHVFGSLGVAINHQNINSGLRNTRDQSAFALTMTGSLSAALDLASIVAPIFQSSENRELDLNFLPIPSYLNYDKTQEVKFGGGLDSDAFSLIFRLSHGSSALSYAAAHNYVENLPLYVYRLRPTHPMDESKIPLSSAQDSASTNETATSEQSLRAGLVVLYARVLKELEQENFVVWRNWFTMHRAQLFGESSVNECIGTWASFWIKLCSGGSTDYSYHAMFPNVMLEPDDDLYVLGVNHKRTGASIHTQIGLVNVEDQVGFVGVSGDELNGSADKYLKNSIAEEDAPYLYIVKFSNRCLPQERFCFPIASRTTPSLLTKDSQLLVTEQFFFRPTSGRVLSDDELVVVKPTYLVARPQDKQDAKGHHLWLQVLSIFSYSLTPFSIDFMLIYALAQEYTTAIIVTYIAALLCCTSFCYFPARDIIVTP